MGTVMVSGHFDPFHDGHLDYLEQAWQSNLGNYLVVLVSSDKQVIMKKGKVNIPEAARRRIIELILVGLARPGSAIINIWDNDTPLIAEALKALRPMVLFRGGDKNLETMPLVEREVCEELGIQIVHGEFRIERHGSKFDSYAGSFPSEPSGWWY